MPRVSWSRSSRPMPDCENCKYFKKDSFPRYKTLDKCTHPGREQKHCDLERLQYVGKCKPQGFHFERRVTFIERYWRIRFPEPVKPEFDFSQQVPEPYSWM